MGWYLVSRITGILEMIFSLDNFDVIFLQRLHVNRFVSVLLITIIIIYLWVTLSFMLYFCCYIISTLIIIVRTKK